MIADLFREEILETYPSGFRPAWPSERPRRLAKFFLCLEFMAQIVGTRAHVGMRLHQDLKGAPRLDWHLSLDALEKGRQYSLKKDKKQDPEQVCWGQPVLSADVNQFASPTLPYDPRGSEQVSFRLVYLAGSCFNNGWSPPSDINW